MDTVIRQLGHTFSRSKKYNVQLAGWDGIFYIVYRVFLWLTLIDTTVIKWLSVMAMPTW
jgi:hypothetical protein